MVVGIDAADEVLHALVQIGSPSGGDRWSAAWVVAWALLPAQLRWHDGAGGSGRRMRWSPASSGWRSGSSLGGGTKDRRQRAGDIRSAIAREGALKRPSWAERRTVPTDRVPEQQLHEQVPPSEELSDVLSWGEQVGLIGSAIASCSASLMEHTDRLGVRTGSRGGQGLMSAPALAETAAEFGLHPEQCADARGGASTRSRQLAGRPIRAFDLSARGCCAETANGHHV